MADRKTTILNWFETELTAQMGPTDLEAVVAATAPATSPAILVIEPNSETQREVVFFDGTFTATKFVATGIGNRYLSGSAAGSGLTHPAGSTVRLAVVAQHVNDTNDRIDADRADIAALQASTHTEDHATRHVAGGADVLEVENSDYTTTQLLLGSGATLVATTPLVIPAAWGSFDLLVQAGWHREATQSSTIGTRVRLDGTTIRMHGAWHQDRGPGHFTNLFKGRTETGTINVELTLQGVNGEAVSNVGIYARARRAT